MGLIKALQGSFGGVLGEQWKEYFYCDSLANTILIKRGRKKQNARTSNTQGDNNIISNGSIIAVNDGQCAVVVQGGQVVELVAEPGEYVFDKSTSPTIFSGGFGAGLVNIFKETTSRFSYGGDVNKDQRVFYINTKEITNNKFGTPTALPYRIVDKNIGLDIDLEIRCNGYYSYKIANPITFYKNVAGNVQEEYNKEAFEEQLKSEFISALQPALAKIGENGIRPNQLSAASMEIADAMDNVLSTKWGEIRGLDIISVSFNSITLTPEDSERLKNAQESGMYRDPNMAAGMLARATGKAMEKAADNQNGAMTGFMGMGMAQNFGNNNISNLYAMGQQNNLNNQNMAQNNTQTTNPQDAAQTVSQDTWTCECGNVNNGNFCSNCGKAKPNPTWKCECGNINNGNFCSNCGKAKP